MLIFPLSMHHNVSGIKNTLLIWWRMKENEEVWVQMQYKVCPFLNLQHTHKHTCHLLNYTKLYGSSFAKSMNLAIEFSVSFGESGFSFRVISRSQPCTSSIGTMSTFVRTTLLHLRVFRFLSWNKILIVNFREPN